MNARVFLRTYGCTLNQADSDIIRGVLAKGGARLVDDEEDADVVVLNTCGVKSATENRIIEKMRALNARNKKIVVAGCIPSANLALVERFAPRACVVGTGSVGRILDAVKAAREGRKVVFLDGKGVIEKASLPKKREGVIARIPIAEGCVGACTFCQTRLARGRLRSYDEEYLACEIERCVKNGFREIQLTAQDTGAYGLERQGGGNLAGLVRRISDVEGAIFAKQKCAFARSANCEFRVRVGMINPEHARAMLPELISAFRSGKIYKFLHVPVQSGSDSVLYEMRRPYQVRDFRFVVSGFRRAFPEITLATDVIVGYPTESEEDFRASLELISEIEPDIVNVSKFCPRPGTSASELKLLPNDVIKKRSGAMSALCRKIALEKNRKLIGKEYAVLATEREKRGVRGRNNAYKQVVLRDERVALGSFVNVKVAGATACCLIGERVRA
ncbi:MAG: tRNA (N(6)-L-threonylcarbamoyladenosine(37)-C(2))-methylthiotransferase [Candidatus Micrarchaeota archaeon]